MGRDTAYAPYGVLHLGFSWSYGLRPSLGFVNQKIRLKLLSTVFYWFFSILILGVCISWSWAGWCCWCWRCACRGLLGAAYSSVCNTANRRGGDPSPAKNPSSAFRNRAALCAASRDKTVELKTVEKTTGEIPPLINFFPV